MMRTIILFVLLYAVFIYFVFVMPRKREQKKRNELYSKLREGLRISTISGIYCTIVDLTETDVVVEISADASKPIRARLMKGGIRQIEEE